MTFDEILEKTKERFPNAVEEARPEEPGPYLFLKAEAWAEAAEWLRNEPALSFDFLMLVSGVDPGPDTGELHAVYHLFSFKHRHYVTVKVRTPRESAKVASVTHLWSGAEWLERETYDLTGIRFENHPDLTRILLPEDWEGWPLRKDYQVQEFYHDIPVPYAPSDQEVDGGTRVTARRLTGPLGTFRSVREEKAVPETAEKPKPSAAPESSAGPKG
jgi:NADH-quinone oxidoreductase subunit C